MRGLKLSVIIVASILWSSSPGKTQSYDGPAELPRSVPSSTYPDACSFTANEIGPDACGFGVKIIATKNGATDGPDLNAELADPTACGSSGEIIAVEPNVPVSKAIALPKNGCGGEGKWIIIRSNVSDSALPKAGTRIQTSYLTKEVHSPQQYLWVDSGSGRRPSV